ncbi:hypothetical protein SERLADRAFT_404743 [Serpula lacrymans var. lacrymans S7.9]|uniref:Uncharacterized protein n=1 Tax=Serpula lacrymans var. lacrymans (strain S7.9) TaxID=578457 RepID=F8NEP3_SERL9|nr:uncharacterized protein SERLADRAFT_404743 [Serpula lacrymans var. lacrymans S7.9]EGO30677.1 hypothetical protein SERLADRAFT_404743 [Serpula lacrymans var. lacrymans S7.9]
MLMMMGSSSAWGKTHFLPVPKAGHNGKPVVGQNVHYVQNHFIVVPFLHRGIIVYSISKKLNKLWKITPRIPRIGSSSLSTNGKFLAISNLQDGVLKLLIGYNELQTVCVWVEASDETMSKKPTHNSQETAEREASDKNAADKLDVTSEAHKDSNLHIELPDLAETGSKSVKPTARNESEIGRSGCIGLITCFALLVTIIAVLLMMQILEEDGMGTLEEIVEALVPDIDVEVK